MSGFHIEPLGAHSRAGFDCGAGPLNEYFVKQVSQDERRSAARCYVVLDGEKIAGFYTLSALAIARDFFDEGTIKRLARYPEVSAALVGRLAVDVGYQNSGLGSAMLEDAARRCRASEIAVAVLVVDAKSDQAAQFYEKNGFVRFAVRPLRLFSPL